MNNKHKWYNEIVAWAGGQKVEECKAGIWYETDYPDFNAKGHEFRIKPQPKQKKYLYVMRNPQNGSLMLSEYHNRGVSFGKIKLEVDDDASGT